MSVPRAASKRPVVLLVEDDADAQEIVSSMLRHYGFDVLQARSIAEAHECARNQRPNVVVLDCRLPDGDGLGLARDWRKLDTMVDVPVIVLTAFSARQDMEAALLAGVDAFLVKPIPMPILAQQIEKVLMGQRPSSKLRKV